MSSKDKYYLNSNDNVIKKPKPPEHQCKCLKNKKKLEREERERREHRERRERLNLGGLKELEREEREGREHRENRERLNYGAFKEIEREEREHREERERRELLLNKKDNKSKYYKDNDYENKNPEYKKANYQEKEQDDQEEYEAANLADEYEPANLVDEYENLYKKKRCPKNEACSLISVADPQTKIIIPAANANESQTCCETLRNWRDLIIDVEGSFDSHRGIYTPQADGDYRITAVINYKINGSAITNALLKNANIYLSLVDDHTCQVLLSSQASIVRVKLCDSDLNITGQNTVAVDISYPPIRGTIVLGTVISLKKCQRIRLVVCVKDIIHKVCGTVPSDDPEFDTNIKIDFAPKCANSTLVIARERSPPVVKIIC